MLQDHHGGHDSSILNTIVSLQQDGQVSLFVQRRGRTRLDRGLIEDLVRITAHVQIKPSFPINGQHQRVVVPEQIRREGF